MNDEHDKSDEWELRDVLYVTVGFTLGIVFLAHVVVTVARAIPT
jgi:hypothetical protein